MENTNVFIQNKYLKMLSEKWGPFCSDSNVLRKPWEDFIIGYANVDLFDQDLGQHGIYRQHTSVLIHTMFHIVIG